MSDFSLEQEKNYNNKVFVPNTGNLIIIIYADLKSFVKKIDGCKNNFLKTVYNKNSL